MKIIFNKLKFFVGIKSENVLWWYCVLWMKHKTAIDAITTYKLGCDMLTRREVEKREILLFDAFEDIGINHVQDILRLDLDTLKEFHSYLGSYISRLEREELNNK